MIWFWLDSCQVYDYDWGLRDDFMGEASLPLGQLVQKKRNDLVLTLAETGGGDKNKKRQKITKIQKVSWLRLIYNYFKTNNAHCSIEIRWEFKTSDKANVHIYFGQTGYM